MFFLRRTRRDYDNLAGLVLAAKDGFVSAGQ